MPDFSATLITDVPDLVNGLLGGGQRSAYVMEFRSLDSSLPLLSGFSPAEGTTLSKYDTITFDVTDVLVDDLLTVTVIVYVYIVATDTDELAYAGTGESSGITNKYNSRISGESASTVTPIANGLRFVLRRKGGWPTGGIKVRVLAVDRGGNIGTL
jgi:hypothetical protein